MAKGGTYGSDKGKAAQAADSGARNGKAELDQPKEIELITTRRKLATANCSRNSFGAGSEDEREKKRVAFVGRQFRTGIAFSGGGIRSATLSLGLTEALAAQGRFYAFDMMSTVSGGGYFGSFLRSLFVAREHGQGQNENDAIVRANDRLAFADSVMTSHPNQQYFRSDQADGFFLQKKPASANDPGTVQIIKNPLWWLRENGRYLAPNGMTDYVFALVYFIRNWLTLMVAILAAMILLFAGLQMIIFCLFTLNSGLEAFSAAATAAEAATLGTDLTAIAWSPLLVVLPLLLLIAAGIGLGYWFTLGMRYFPTAASTQTPAKERQAAHRRDIVRLGQCWTVSGLIICALLFVDLRSDDLALSLEHGTSIMLMSAILSSWLATRPLNEAEDGATDKAVPLRALFASNKWMLAGLALAVGLIVLMIRDLIGIQLTGWRSFIIPSAMMIVMIALLITDLSTRPDVPMSMASYMRRLQTRHLSFMMQLIAFLAVIGIVDSLGLFTRALSNAPEPISFAKTALTSSVVLSIIASLVAKLPDWFGDSKLGVIRLIRANASSAALIAAILMLSALAVLADVLVLKALWKGPAWGAGVANDWFAFLALAGGALILFLMIGTSRQFLNQSALAPIYTSRLGRAYIGGSNVYRLNLHTPSDITRSMVGDELAVQHYMIQPTAAPLHLINVTRNRTVGSYHAGAAAKNRPPDDPLVSAANFEGDEGAAADQKGRVDSYESHLTLRDRKGDRMVVGPLGIRAGAEFFDWATIKNSDDEPLTLSRLCAISGAAVSSGMGRNTSLGTAMALTLSNVRLGYWWRAPKIKSDAPTKRRPLLLRVRAKLVTWLPSYFFLFDEMVARYDRDEPYWYLSDGGHSENSGALSLLERGCRFILVADNGQDPDYHFSDLETFIRSARTDIGKEVRPATPEEMADVISMSARHCFLNSSDGDWAKRLTARGNEAFALLLRAAAMDRVENGQRIVAQDICWIVWLKPTLFKGVPADIVGYGLNNPDFPQQSTANQFFDEAQWESYRRLGFAMGSQLFADPQTLAEEVPIIYQGLRPTDASEKPSSN